MDFVSAYTDQSINSVIAGRVKNSVDNLAVNHLGNNNLSRHDKVKAVANEFEAIFVTQMIRHMYSGIETDENLGGGNGERVFREFLFDEYGKIVSDAGGFGIAESVQRELLKLQEAGI